MGWRTATGCRGTSLLLQASWSCGTGSTQSTRHRSASTWCTGPTSSAVVQGEDPESAFGQVVSDTADVWPPLGLSPEQAAATAAVHRWAIIHRDAIPDVVEGTAPTAVSSGEQEERKRATRG